ncbi:lysophospholipid acyltransferase family protein [Pseudonocardia xinjiangensis]|uniref:1-acyl-sn-glycerol-3-phosphate acyltransferase n=1 Tax=Pseudonocardia xinjiangensis TaxID=75289 RepID=A0ABX1R7K1_9PSEU|nr:lysophospholipid acyltransferase family protein [Pseudonocardia xinjiangensis]NMH76332.1 1-acyl-sn-glycerol-3-phosphate acyltransferase [Pseudonocardia xinjiangensis]
MTAPTALPHPAQQAAGWAPSSPCGPGCLQDDDRDAASRLRMASRLARLVGVLLAAVLVGAVLAVPLLRGPVRGHALRVGCRAALRAVGVRLRVNGGFSTGRAGVLVVANHLSWIDVLAMGAVQPVRMLAKQELRDWPVIGGLAARTGALFVDRAGLRSLPATVAATTQALRSGAVVGVFPEGTTWCGAAAGTFRRAAFQAAVDAQVPVRPVAIGLRRPDGTADRSSAFVGDQTLWDSLSRVLRLPALVCELTVLPVIPPGVAADRRELARLAADAVGAHTGVTHPHTRHHPSCAAAPVAA